MLKLREELVFYGSYHTNKWNQLIHFVFVPVIMFGILTWLASSGPVIDVDTSALTRHLPECIARAFVLNLGLVPLGIYTVLYTYWDILAGLSWTAAIGIPLWLAANAFQQQTRYAWAWGLFCFVLGFYMQIHPGHYILEKRKPALLDSIIQAFLTAPLFVWYELLFLLGYRRDLKRQVDIDIANLLAQNTALDPDSTSSTPDHQSSLLQS